MPNHGELQQEVPEHQYIIAQTSIAVHAGPEGFIFSAFLTASTTVRSWCGFGVDPETFPKEFAGDVGNFGTIWRKIPLFPGFFDIPRQ
jgi:hypothetical protein